jgi:hypothetical protein
MNAQTFYITYGASGQDIFWLVTLPLFCIAIAVLRLK